MYLLWSSIVVLYKKSVNNHVVEDQYAEGAEWSKLVAKV